MSENNGLPDRKIKNTLFSASVTGATIEEFQQNALLFPAQNIPVAVPQPAPQQEQFTQQSLTTSDNTNLYHPEDIFNQNPQGYPPEQSYNPQEVSNFGYFQQPDPQVAPVENLVVNNNQNTGASPFSSVFSTFSSYFSGTASKKPPTPPPPAPSSIENLIGQGSQDSGPVPLFNPVDIPEKNTLPPTNTGGNTYRRGGLKRPVYAAVPGLSSAATNPPVAGVSTSDFVAPNLPPLPTTTQRPSASNSPQIHQPNLTFTTQSPSLGLPPSNPSSFFTPPSQPTLQAVSSEEIKVSSFQNQPVSSFQTPISSFQIQESTIPSFPNQESNIASFANQESTVPIQDSNVSSFQHQEKSKTPPIPSFLNQETSIKPPTLPNESISVFQNQDISPVSSFFQSPTAAPPVQQSQPFLIPFSQETSTNLPLTNAAVAPATFTQPPLFQTPSAFSAAPPPLAPPPASKLESSSTQNPFRQGNSNNYTLSAYRAQNSIVAPPQPPKSFSPSPVALRQTPPSAVNSSFDSIFPPPVPATANLFAPGPIPAPSANATPFLEPVDDICLPNTESLASIPSQNLHPIMEATQSLRQGSPASMTGATNNSSGSQMYRSVYHHWFYMTTKDTKITWTPFSMTDSLALETAFATTDLSPDDLLPTDGGRFDVNILRRQRSSVYWPSEPNEVRRCSWFYKNDDGKFRPYEESVAGKLEEEYKKCFESNTWNHTVTLSNGDNVTFHSADVLVVFPKASEVDTWGNTPTQTRTQIVKRGVSDFDIDEGETEKVDHILFVVHGIGSVCDLKFRTVEEVVDEFRSNALQLVRTHYKSSHEKGLANRIEVLPISWHSKLHSEDTGIDNRLKGITLESIPRLRNFTNDTLLDILFYTSPVYCQTIISTVANELNRIYDLYKKRNPQFTGSIYLGGHSLGSLILFDILSHQREPEPKVESSTPPGETDEDTLAPLKPHPKERSISRRISYMMSNIGTGQAQLTYPSLHFQPVTFFALGSPIGMFVAVRGLDQLGEEFILPTCPGFFNIFHPQDPVAYRVEPLVNSQLSSRKPVLIPHHKGRKRMHLELKETMARVGADFKQKLMESMKGTLNSLYQFALFRSDPPFELDKEKTDEEKKEEDEGAFSLDSKSTDVSLGQLNKGRRFDYVLQEAPFESLNEYLFALASHCCYWGSADTMLLILKEIYSSMGLQTDSQIPQQTMTIERAPPSPIFQRSDISIQSGFGIDPTLPMASRSDLLPPPVAGFVRKS